MDSSGRKEPHRELRSSTKVNSEFKWKHDPSVVGALEILIDPYLDLNAKMILHEVLGYERELEKYCKIWKKFKLRDEFVKAFESIPPETTCCGLCTEQDKTIKQNAILLKKGWVKSTNENILKKEGFRISFFVWCWTNISGKSETVIPMIRFHRLSENDKNRYSPKSENLGSIDELELSR